MRTPVLCTRDRLASSHCGFTIIELLVVIGIVAILMSVLLPALGGARRAMRLVGSMSNTRQITTAAITYTNDQPDGMWPLVPAFDTGSVVGLDSWTYGGKTADRAYWGRFSGRYLHEVQTRPLNRYLYPNLHLRDPSDDRLELEIYRCPADNGTYQRGKWWVGPGPEIDYTISCYDDVGTSYQLNIRWWTAALRENAIHPNGPRAANSSQLWRLTRRWFTRSFQGTPSRFIWLYDQVMDVVSFTGANRPGFHGGTNRSVTAFMDGHVAYTDVTPGAFEGPTYTLKFASLYAGPRPDLPGQNR